MNSYQSPQTLSRSEEGEKQLSHAALQHISTLKLPFYQLSLVRPRLAILENKELQKAMCRMNF